MIKSLCSLTEYMGLSVLASSNRTGRELLIDVSVIARQDARTGIQRVVRAIWLHLPMLVPVGVQVRPVYAGKRHGYVYAPDDFLERGLPDKPSRTDRISLQKGDVFVGLDLAAHLIPRYEKQIAGWKARGVSINLLVYDLLPVNYPEWFNARTTRNFNRWLATIARQADQAICISAHVAGQLQSWMDKYSPDRKPPLLTSVIRLGADIAASGPSTGLADNAASLMAKIAGRKAVLMVGTIEPRKGHDDAIAAFDHLWAQDTDAPVLVIVGKPGWKTEALQWKLVNHPETDKRLFWLKNVSDEMLESLFKLSSALLAASRAEGFGLPLAEGVRSGLPVLARDLPVFRELNLPGVSFFNDSSPAALAEQITVTLAQRSMAKGKFNVAGWEQATCDLLGVLGIPAPHDPSSQVTVCL